MDLIDDLEAMRQEMRVSQSEIARQLGISQGHYSKVAARNAPLTRKMAVRIEHWLNANAASGALQDEQALQEIFKKCISLMHSLERYLGN